MSQNNNNNNNNNNLRKQITEINNDKSIDASEKARRIQDEANRVLGCAHYQRNCKLKAACCGRLFTCRFCHDEKSDHEINRFATKEIFCLKCKTLQPVSNACINETCGTTFAKYYCEICKFFDDDASKSIYHCPHCGICRKGEGLGIDFQHCMKCNACLAVEGFAKHKCIENKFEGFCPICREYHEKHDEPHGGGQKTQN